MVISVQAEDFDPGREHRLLQERAGDAGAIVTFTGLVRELLAAGEGDAGKVRSLRIEHYPGMTERRIEEIAREAGDRWELLACRVVHRTGPLAPGDRIVFVGAAARHRRDAFDAAAFIMDFLKGRAPFWKKQTTADGGGGWVDSRRGDEEALERWRQGGA